jgi:hypothetical protein
MVPSPSPGQRVDSEAEIAHHLCVNACKLVPPVSSRAQSRVFYGLETELPDGAGNRDNVLLFHRHRRNHCRIDPSKQK